MIPNKAIRNIRIGLATNSSSSHSIIFAPDIIDDVLHTCWDGGLCFGWECFVAATRGAKIKYLDGILLSNEMNFTRILDIVAKDMLGEREAKKLSKSIDIHIDHQSIFPLPGLINNKGINLEFFQEYKEYISNNPFVIIGGNDSDEAPCPIVSSYGGPEKDSFIGKFKEGDEAYRNGNYWVLRGKARRVRIAFHDDPLEPKYPELIDLKITDYCPFGCDFCYQDSSKDGVDADIKDIMEVISWSDPTEIAIGGGEPTMHKEFATVLCRLHYNGLNVVNFTTRSKKWFSDREIVRAVNRYVSGVAYSVNTPEEAREFLELHSIYLPDVEAYVHIIPELIGEKATLEIAAELVSLKKEISIYPHITILGYKTTGRGGDSIPYKTTGVINKLKQFSIPVGVDTLFMQRYEDYINADAKFYSLREGEFSVYYDAVEGKTYRSSYELDAPYDIRSREKGKSARTAFLEAFQKIRSE